MVTVAVLCFFAAASHLRFAIRRFFNDFFLLFLVSIFICRCYKEENERRRFGGAVAHSIVSPWLSVCASWYRLILHSREFDCGHILNGLARSRKHVIAKPSFACSFFALADFSQLSLNHILLSFLAFSFCAVFTVPSFIARFASSSAKVYACEKGFQTFPRLFMLASRNHGTEIHFAPTVGPTNLNTLWWSAHFQSKLFVVAKEIFAVEGFCQTSANCHDPNRIVFDIWIKHSQMRVTDEEIKTIVAVSDDLITESPKP